MRTQYIDFKDKVSHTDLHYINPYLFQILAYISIFCMKNKTILQLTSIHDDSNQDLLLGRVSKSHQEWRAFDMSLRHIYGWNDLLITKLEDEINQKFKDIGAISAKSGISTPIVIHDNGNGYHAHIQVRKGLL